MVLRWEVASRLELDLPPGKNFFFQFLGCGVNLGNLKKLNDFMDATDWHPGWEVDPTSRAAC